MGEYIRDATEMIFGSSRYGAFSSLANLNKHHASHQAASDEALKHQILCFRIYTYQVERGRYFCHEHPHTATWWGLPFVEQLRRLPQVMEAVCDQCMFGQTVIHNGIEQMAKKPMRFLTNCPRVYEALHVQCAHPNGSHQVLIGGLAKQCEVYPP